ncbi:hypothetical protein DXG01_010184 [Tephrocybe rancida]|nr:hypothetical protein DXG01_010184 [Tephrocybe rancida]
MEKEPSKHSRNSIELEKSPYVERSSFDSLGHQERYQVDKKVWWKLDLCILPVVTMFYFLSWLDRTNLGNARVAGLQKDLKMTNTQGSSNRAFSGLLATAIMRLNGKGGHPAWAWIFIVEGAFTIGFGLVSFFILPRSPAHAMFLSADEKEYVTMALREGGAIGKNEAADGFSWAEVRKTFFLPQLWLLCCVYFLNGMHFIKIIYPLLNRLLLGTIVYSLG